MLLPGHTSLFPPLHCLLPNLFFPLRLPLPLRILLSISVVSFAMILSFMDPFLTTRLLATILTPPRTKTLLRNSFGRLHSRGAASVPFQLPRRDYLEIATAGKKRARSPTHSNLTITYLTTGNLLTRLIRTLCPTAFWFLRHLIYLIPRSTYHGVGSRRKRCPITTSFGGRRNSSN